MNTMPIQEFMRIVCIVGNQTWIRYQLNYGSENLVDHPQIMALHIVDLAKMNTLHFWINELHKVGLSLKCIENVNGIEMATFLVERDDNKRLQSDQNPPRENSAANINSSGAAAFGC